MLRFSPPASTRLEQSTLLHSHVAGTESNTLACLSMLGLRCAWISCLPENPMGRRIERELRGHGLDTRKIVWAGTDARLGLFYADESPEPLGTQVYYDRTNSACALIDPEAVDYSVVTRCKLLHLTGITPALSPNALWVFNTMLDTATSAGVEVSFDVNYRGKLWSPERAAEGVEEACRRANLLFCTLQDSAELWGYVGEAHEVLRKLASRFGTDKIIVLTLGGEGSAHLVHGEFESAPAFPSGGSVRFGSGDAFAAGYLYAYIRNREQKGSGLGDLSSLAIGNALAALKRGIAGDIAVVTPEETLAVAGQQKKRFR